MQNLEGPEDINILVQSADAFVRVEETEQGIAVLRRVLRIDPSHAYACARLGDLLIRTGRLQEAEPILRRAVKLAPQHAHLYGQLGTVLSVSGQHSEAMKMGRTAVDLEPANPHRHAQLGHFLMAAGDFSGADETIRFAISLAPDVPGFHVDLSHALSRAGRLEEAIEFAQRGAAAEPDNSAFQEHLSDLLVRAGRPLSDQTLRTSSKIIQRIWRETYQKTRAARIDAALESIYEPLRPAKIFHQGMKERLYDLVLETIGNRPIIYLEFGVYEGWSMERILQRFSHQGSRFYGFDSFEGLPDAWDDEHPKGFFSTGGSLPTTNDTRAVFLSGWFQNILPDFIDNAMLDEPLLVHFDADLYSSTLFLLTTLWHSVKEYYFIFDEFVPDEIVALSDFMAAYPIEIEFLGSVHYKDNDRPVQSFGWIKRGIYTTKGEVVPPQGV